MKSSDLLPYFQRGLIKIAGYLFIFYITSFLIFACLRVLTGVSIKRLGYFSLRHVSFSPKPGIQVSIGKMGISIHRPTVARPGWLSLYIANLHLIVDPRIVLRQEGRPSKPTNTDDQKNKPPSSADPAISDALEGWSFVPPRTKLFYILRFILRYAQYADFSASSTSILYVGVGTLVVGSFNLRLDLRSSVHGVKNNFVGTLETTRKLNSDEMPAMTRIMAQDFYIADSLDDEHPKEFLDAFGLEIGGVLKTGNMSFKDLSLAFKLGKGVMYLDKMKHILSSLKQIRNELAVEPSRKSDNVFTEADIRNLTNIGTLMVRVVKEVEFKFAHLSVFGIPAASDVAFAASAKDLSLDTRRLNEHSPGFKLFFSETDAAHQAIFSMSSISFAVDTGLETQDELMYIPMVTVISKTNVFSKTLQFVRDTNTTTNESIIRANVNVTSPTVDLEARHVPILLEFLSSPSSNGQSRKRGVSETAKSFQRLWPRAAVKLTIDEPAARLLLSPMDMSDANAPRAMVISSSSKIHCDFESSHAIDFETPSYSAHASLQVTSYDTWYRSASGNRFDLFLSENLLLKITAVMNPSLSVMISGILSNANVLLTKGEVFRGIREFCLHFKKGSKAKVVSKSTNVLNQLPPWLNRLKIEIADTAVSVASEQHQNDNDVVRGLTLQMSNSVIEYRSDKGRRKLAMIMEGIEGYKIIEPFEMNKNDINRFLQIPSLSVALGAESTSLLQCNLIIKNALIKYDINLHFLALMSATLLKHTLAMGGGGSHANTSAADEFIGVHIKTGTIRIKVELPNNAHLMLETNSLELQRKKDYRPRMRAKAIRLYSLHPTVPNAWGRIVSLRGAHAEYKTKHESDEAVSLSFDGMRLNVPSQYIFHQVLDNVVTMFKAVVNLQRYKIGDEFYEAVARPKERSKMPNFPKIRIRTPALLVTLEDDHFESQIGLIYQVGMREQRIRLEKERAFEAKADAIKLAREDKIAAKDSIPSEVEAKPQRKGTELSVSSSISTGAAGDQSLDQQAGDETTGDGPANPHTRKPKRHHTGLLSFHKQGGKRSNVNYTMTSNVEPTTEANVGIDEARDTLNRHFSTSWIKAFNAAAKNQKAAVRQNIENCWGSDEIDVETAVNERIVEYSDDPLMFYALFRNLDLMLKKPAFDDTTLREFLHNVGKGLPMDTRFSLLIPLYVDLKLTELRCQLRDYPLPLIHFPELYASQDPNVASFHLRGNLVIAEELFLDEASLRRINVPLVPIVNTEPDEFNVRKYVVNVVRTIASVKTYTDLKITVNTMNPTRITWANSIQPAIQTVMLGFDSFTKPPIDPSAKVGFWDKIRSIFHARLRFEWTHGDVFLLLKGSRSPYNLLGDASGFVMGWRNNVTLVVNGDDDPKKLLVTNSEEYMLAIPNYVAQESDYLKKSNSFQHALMPWTDFNESSTFRKVVMKLSGKVQWVAGLLFELDKPGTRERSSAFKNHYEIQLKRPDAIENLENYDAYDGFRSQYMHLALSVSSPELEDSSSYNTVHLTPRVLAHFTHWWGLFDGSLSLPTRAGPLFQPRIIKKPKFGRHLFTVKYKLTLAPLFISHVYRHPYSDDLKKHNKQASTGLKGKVENFSMDLHQRREQEHGKRWRMKVHMGELDFKSTDLRVVMAQFKDKSPAELLAKKLGVGESPGSSISHDKSSTSHSANTSNNISGKFKISDNDYTWIDMDDYVELDDTISMRHMPKVKVLPLIYTPRWTYFRQTDHSNSDLAEVGGESYVKFGNEPSHDCVIGKNHPEVTQHNLLRQRIDELDEQLKNDEATLESLVNDLKEYPNEKTIQERVEAIGAEIVQLNDRKEAIRKVLAEPQNSCELGGDDHSFDGLEEMTNPDNNENSFNNRFIIHNVQLKWNNSVRDAMYRYMHKSGDRRAFSYFLTRKAVKYIEDMIAKHKNFSDEASAEGSDHVSLSASYREESESGFSGLFKGICDDENSTSEERIRDFEKNLRNSLEGTYADDTYLVRLTSPQIQLVSEQNPDQCVLVTSQNIELKILSVMDEQNDDDEISGLVETRYGVFLQDAQFFVLSKADVSGGSIALFSTNNYGSTGSGISSWPPWLALEMCYQSKSLSNQLVVDRTTATLRYDKPNSLRLERDDISAQGSEIFSSKVARCERYRSNRIAVDFPKVVANCDSQQYFAVYTIVIDLLIYSEPSHQKTNEKLEELLLATDFSDLDGVVSRLNQLQTDIRQLQELRNEFAIHLANSFDDKANEDLMTIEVEHHQVVLELMVMMRAVRQGLQRGDRGRSQLLKWAIASDQIIWHVLEKDKTPFLDIGLADASFNRIESDDGFNSNTVEIGMMQGFNLLPKSLYPELFSPFIDPRAEVATKNEKLIYVEWTMLDPIGGIPIVDNFYVNLQPLKVQLEHDTGQKIFEYIFPSNEESPFIIPRLPKNGEGQTDDESKAESDSDESDASVATSSRNSIYSMSQESSRKFGVANGGGSGHPLANRVLQKSSTLVSKGTFRRGAHHENSPATDANSIASKSNTDQQRATSVYSGITKSGSKKSANENAENENDFAVMVKRASNYMSIVDIKIDSTTLCVSYKGQGTRNLTDIHEFVIRLPVFEYKNKTWSNLDLALRLKKDVIKALFQHTGALISNKFTRRKKKLYHQPLRQISNYVSFTSVADLTDSASSIPQQTGSVAKQKIPRIEISGSSPEGSHQASKTDISLSSSPSTQPQSPRAVSTDAFAHLQESPLSSGLRSRATSFVKGIVNSASNTSSPVTQKPSSLSHAMDDGTDDLAKQKSATSFNATSGLNASPNRNQNLSTHASKGKRSVPVTPQRSRTRDSSDVHDSEGDDSEFDRDWSNSDDMLDSTDDEKQTESDRRSEEANLSGKKKRKGFFKKLLT